MKIEKKTFSSRIEVKLADTSTETAVKTFSGYGACFNNTDSYNDVIAPGAFKASLSRHADAGTMPLMLLNHDAWNQLPIGVWKSMSEDENGLLVEGELLDTAAGADVYTALKAGAITGLSIGYRVTGYEMDGKSRTITEADLMEVSVVTFPANDLARVQSVKSEEEASVEAEEDDDILDDDAIKSALTKAGFDEDSITALFASRKSDDAEEDEGTSGETKYSQADLAAIRKLTETIKEKYVR